jgi:hypothetical protein
MAAYGQYLPHIPCENTPNDRERKGGERVWEDDFLGNYRLSLRMRQACHKYFILTLVLKVIYRIQRGEGIWDSGVA